jgi:hypothetical protein
MFERVPMPFGVLDKVTPQAVSLYNLCRMNFRSDAAAALYSY